MLDDRTRASYGALMKAVAARMRKTILTFIASGDPWQTEKHSEVRAGLRKELGLYDA
jgi:hypothetical protein